MIITLPTNIWLALLPAVVAAVVGLALVYRNLMWAGLCLVASGLLMLIAYTPATDAVATMMESIADASRLSNDLPADVIRPPMPAGYILFAIALMVVGVVMEAVAFHRRDSSPHHEADRDVTAMTAATQIYTPTVHSNE